MKKFLIFIFFAFFTITSALDSPFEKEDVVLSDGWRVAQATLMDYSERDLAERDLAERDFGAQITFYEGQDLKNSACYGRNGLRIYDAKPTDAIAAMWMKDFEMCYQCIEIKNGKKSVKSIIVKVIDKCAGCPPHKKNVDLTRSAFSQLAAVSVGRVEIIWRPLPICPKTGAWPTFEQKKGKRKSKRS